MAQRIRSIIVVCALLLAVMAAWTHISTSLIGSEQAATDSARQTVHAHDSLPGDHAHTPLMGDHQHEIPHLGVAPALKHQVAVSSTPSEPRYRLPSAPIFQIKRPPRPRLVI